MWGNQWALIPWADAARATPPSRCNQCYARELYRPGGWNPTGVGEPAIFREWVVGAGVDPHLGSAPEVAPGSCPSVCLVLAGAGGAGLPHRLQSGIPQLTPGAFVQAVRQGGDLRHHGQPFPPLRGYCLGSVICPGDLPIDGAGRVGVVPEVDDP